MIKELINNLQTNWREILLSYPDLEDIETFLATEKEIFGTEVPTHPSPENLLQCFKYNNIEDIKVVILGQDPYHGDGQATGLCFAVSNSTKTPPSLRNIQNELVNDIGIDLVSKTLEHWAKQGVLLLNTALSVRHKTPAAHMSIWLPFTKYIIQKLNEQDKIVFVAWGAFAYDKLKNIDEKRHHLLVSSHPSPLSASRKYKTFASFKGSKPFSKINSLIENKIHW